jgi:opacity protein-like surface antigen
MKTSIVFISILFSVLSVCAQDQEKVRLGIKIGVNYSNVNKVGINFYHSVYEDSYKVGYQFGAFSDINIVSKVTLRPELSFSSQGQNVLLKENLLSIPVVLREITVIENYIIVPLLIKLELLPGLNTFLGPQLDYLFYLKEKKLNDDISTLNDELFKPSFSFGLLGGVGYELTSKLEIDLRYNLGFERNKGHTYPKTLSIYNSVLGFNVNYTLN